MIKILHSADWHIALNKKRIPNDWQINRFKLFFNKLFLLEKEVDIHIIAGDIFDKQPTNEEICLFLHFVNNANIPTFIIPGNHEATKRGKSFLENFIKYNAINNHNIKIFTNNKNIQINDLTFQFFPYGEMQLNNLPKHKKNSILITHIRGEVPPHVSPEYDFNKLTPWKLVLLGDLHFNHKYKNYPFYYSGSPLNISFTRDITNIYGVNIITLDNLDNYKVNFIDLKLPKLIRKTIETSEKIEKSKYDHVIYEIVGNIDELSQIKNNELLDKKISLTPTENSKLNLSEHIPIEEQLYIYLKYIKIKNIDSIMKVFTEINDHSIK